MKNILLTGVGGQGTVLAAKVLAQAAQAKGWHVRTAETIGMAQRGGSVTSHVRMGDRGEEVFSPLLAHGSADLIVAFEPAEAARSLPYLSRGGLLVTARIGIQPVTSSLAAQSYDPEALLAELGGRVGGMVAVDDAALCERAGSRKALNTVLLATAIAEGERRGDGLAGAVSVDDMRAAIAVCVKPRFVDMNLAAIDIALDALA
ncbi:MAG: indolepyruvate oxidoreductase subunit beta [Coriobacteriales bacterium]|jgi:indolepyruvate ferredoxin oxidoreductase beta subunit